jgi:plasmid stabilization system protein ParE
MTRDVIWSRKSLAELLSVFDYLDKFNPRAAAQVFGALKEAGDTLS